MISPLFCSWNTGKESTKKRLKISEKINHTVSTIKKLCDGLGITIDEFFHTELFAGLEQEIK